MIRMIRSINSMTDQLTGAELVITITDSLISIVNSAMRELIQLIQSLYLLVADSVIKKD